MDGSRGERGLVVIKCYNPDRVKVGDRLQDAKRLVALTVTEKRMIPETEWHKTEWGFCDYVFNTSDPYLVVQKCLMQQKYYWLEIPE